MALKNSFGRLFRELKNLLKESICILKNKFERKESAIERIENFLIKNTKIKEKNLNLIEIIKNEYSDIKEIGKDKCYLWDCLHKSDNYINEWDNIKGLTKKIKNINSFQLEIKDINWVFACKEYKSGMPSLDSYIENNNMLIYFLKKNKYYFDNNKSIIEKINAFSYKTDSEQILNNFNNNEINEIIKVFKNYNSSYKSFHENNMEGIPIHLTPYDDRIEWMNTLESHTHHFLILRYILKKINKSEVLGESKKFKLVYLENNSINKFFNKSEIFVIPCIPYDEKKQLSILYTKELTRNLEKISNIKARSYNDFLFLCLEKNEREHSKLINILKENNFFSLKDYYDKYLKEQNNNLNSYIDRNWITEEEIEKIDGLELF